MSFWDRFRRKKKKRSAEEIEEEELLSEILEKAPIRREDLDITNPKEREQYVRNCCEQMVEASGEVENMKLEYKVVTDYLKDMEELEALPPKDKREISNIAGKIVTLTKERTSYKNKSGTNIITDTQYRGMEKLEEEMPEALEKLEGYEDYQSLVKQDLHCLEGEKTALAFRQSELYNQQLNAKGMSAIAMFAVLVTLLMLFVLQLLFEMDTTIGYLFTVGVAAIAITIIFVRYKSAESEYLSVENALNRIILLQNRVKIKYVNITNLMEYTYGKYNVNSAYELNYLWDKYQEEKAVRERMRRSSGEMDIHQSELVDTLRKYHIKDPNIWLHQAEALVDNKEMVEIRHKLIVRRQRLRKRMDYNNENLVTAKNELNDLVKSYPSYAREIVDIVSEYE